MNWTIVILSFYFITGIRNGDPRIALLVAYLVGKYFNPKETAKRNIQIKSNNYSYIIGDRHNMIGRNRGNGVVVILPTKVPNIFVDQNSNDKKFGLIRNFVDIFPQKLESTFGKNTTVYAKSEEKTDVLTILNPATMDSIARHANKFDIEFAGYFLILWSRKKVMRNPELNQDIVHSTQLILESLDQTLKRWSGQERQYSLIETRLSDKLLKIGSIRVGSIRRIASILLSFAVTFFSLRIAIDTYDTTKYYSGVEVVRIVTLAVWLSVVSSILFIGFSRKKIDIKL